MSIDANGAFRFYAQASCYRENYGYLITKTRCNEVVGKLIIISKSEAR